MQTKFCVNCLHCDRNTEREMLCRHPEALPNPVTGELALCAIERQRGPCGPQAKHFDEHVVITKPMLEEMLKGAFKEGWEMAKESSGPLLIWASVSEAWANSETEELVKK